MPVPTFVDLQGFNVNKKFIVKEVAMLKQEIVLTHYIFTSPMPCALQNVLKIYNCMEHRAVRLLSRRYDLMATGYKFLKIGINVGPPSYVEIALGDHRGHELSLSFET
ncbi:hypothetical protein ALC53_12823 [Atta colombica]|uniref:Uncharacterized protein n=1 Tax=Atta colombica TaxID=520822 RepID=A0A151HYX3_9HYME|nr:hypothetical protein ALC53_12823 [Atta colombica]